MNHHQVQHEWLLAATFALFCVFGILPSTAQTARFGRTVAGITVGQDDLDKVRSLYGPAAETNVDQIRTLCYRFEADGAYLSVSTFERQSRVRNITITTFAAIMPGCENAKVSGKHLVGPAGIRLGASMQAVVAALGKPSETGKMQLGKDELVYADYVIAGGRGTGQFESDKLVLLAIELSDERIEASANSGSAVIGSSASILCEVPWRESASSSGDSHQQGW